MGKELMKEEKKLYLHYFRFWFLAVGILVIAALGKLTWGALHPDTSEEIARTNTQAPTERVYDYADVLTDTEEAALREHIAQQEALYQIDIVLVTMNEFMGESDNAWERAMMNTADDFYDENNYGYDKVHGDGVLLLDNWMEGQKGSWLSTCGSVHERFGDYEIDDVLDQVDDLIDRDPYRAYLAYIDEVCLFMSMDGSLGSVVDAFMPFAVLLVPLVSALCYGFAYTRPFKQTRQVSNTAYVAGGKPTTRQKRDALKNKRVTSVRISTNSGGGSGGGGSHTSGGGVSHGGGGHRR